MGLTLLNAMSSQHLLPTHVQALQAVHGAVHQSDVGVKYTWLGNGYISNMYYKWIANHATYNFGHGGDLSFGATIKNKNIEMVAYGDSEGKPRNQTGTLILTIELTTILPKMQNFELIYFIRMESKLHVSLEYN